MNTKISKKALQKLNRQWNRVYSSPSDEDGTTTPRVGLLRWHDPIESSVMLVPSRHNKLERAARLFGGYVGKKSNKFSKTYDDMENKNWEERDELDKAVFLHNDVTSYFEDEGLTLPVAVYPKAAEETPEVEIAVTASRATPYGTAQQEAQTLRRSPRLSGGDAPVMSLLA